MFLQKTLPLTSHVVKTPGVWYDKSSICTEGLRDFHSLEEGECVIRRDMEYIRMVYRTGSFSKAAEQLFASQSTVSMAVQRVEEELGTRLFERGTSPLRVTEAGKRYLAHADRIAQSEAQLLRELEEIGNLQNEELRLGCLPMHTQSLIPGFLARFTADHPDTGISVVSAFPDELYHLLREGELDLVISNMADTNDVEITYIPAVKERLLVAVPLNFPVNEQLKDFALNTSQIRAGKHMDADCPQVSLSAFSETSFIVPTKRSYFYPFIQSIFSEEEFRPKTCLSVSAPILAFSLARQGLGAALIGSLFIRDIGDSLKYYKLCSQADGLTYYFAIRSNREVTAGQRSMIQAFRAFLDS